MDFLTAPQWDALWQKGMWLYMEHPVVFFILCALFGLSINLWGYRLHRLFLFLFGFFTGMILTTPLLSMSNSMLALFIQLGVGIAVAVLVTAFSRMGVVIWCILSIPPIITLLTGGDPTFLTDSISHSFNLLLDGRFSSLIKYFGIFNWITWLIFASIIPAGILGLLWRRPMMIITTALTGAIFAATGFYAVIATIKSKPFMISLNNVALMGDNQQLIPSLLFMTFLPLGCLFQWYYTRNWTEARFKKEFQ